jgi:hypothetical protein
MRSIAGAPPNGDPVFPSGVQAKIVRSADGPDYPGQLYDRFLDGIGDLRESRLRVASHDGRDAVAVVATLELHPGMTAFVPVMGDQAERTGDSSGANIALHDL